MTLEPLIIDLGPWAIPLGAIFSQALSPATPAMLHRSLAEQACTLLEQAAATASEVPDEAGSWRAMQTADALFLALDDGFAFVQFEGPSVASLRVETDDGRRWSVIRTGQGLLSLPGEGGPDPDLKIALFEDERLIWSHSFYPDGRDADDKDYQGAMNEARDAMAQTSSEGGPGFGLGAAGAAALGAAVLGAGALLARKALERKARKAATPVAPPAPPRPAWRIVGLTGPLQGQSFPVADTAILGRDKTVDIPVEDLSASRHHAELKVLGGGLQLTDLGSSNGTWIGDTQLLAPGLLHDGDTFAIGACRFRAEGPPGETTPRKEQAAPPPPALPPPVVPPAPPLCPQCRKALEPDWQFCGHCGAPLAQPHLCRKCGAPLLEDARFCATCGTPA